MFVPQRAATSLFGGSEESVDQYAVQNVQPELRTRNKTKTATQNQIHKTRNKSTKTKEKTLRGSGRALRSKAACVPMNSQRSCSKQHKPTRPHSKIAMKVQNKTKPPISSAETQDPPRQDPGDLTVKPNGHEAPSSACNGRALKWKATQRQAPCRGEQPNRKE